ncbi:MAG: hypothetical protein U0559_17855 [Anaerolineae bacterium]
MAGPAAAVDKITIVNPATEQPIAQVIDGSRDVDHAVQAASQAFYDGRWSKKDTGRTVEKRCGNWLI